jgi:tRNA(fMet)-specific endonuclease VapC
MIVFDTDVISYVIRPAPPTGLIRRIAQLDPNEQATTSINVGELVYGAYRSRRQDHYLTALKERVWPNIVVLSFDRSAAEVYGELHATLEKKGVTVSEPDLRIASICLSNKVSLSTGNLKHFSKVPGLDVEDWLAPFR